MEAEKSERWIDPRFKAIPIGLADPGPFIKLDDGSLMVVAGNTTLISEDGGRSWSEPRAIYTGAGPGVPTRSAQAVKATDADGRSVIVLIWGEDFQVTWDSARIEPTEDSTADVWAIRSLDGGRTWIDRQRIFEGICSHLPSNIVQAKSGRISAPVQFYMRNPARNVIRNYVSDDAGQTWQGSNIVDLRGEGHHDGAVEPTMVELKDGRLWMLIRTNWDRFWEAYSDDQGLSWQVIQPSNIDASTSPGFLERLASGRLVLIWNRLYPEGKKSFPRRPINRHAWGAQLSDRPAIWHREELSIALSEDEAKTWTRPIVIAREKGASLAYPYLFEPEPGLLWIFSGQGGLQLSARESDLLEA